MRGWGNSLRRGLGLGAVVCAIWAPVQAPVQAADCVARDFLAMVLPEAHGATELASVLAAYPELRFDAETGRITGAGGATVAVTGQSAGSPEQALAAPSFGDQFRYVYPLDFDLETRKAAWHDPGRLRDPAFMTVLYFAEEAGARASLETVRHAGTGTRFSVTRANGVACQLRAVLAEIGPGHDALFRDVGGSFNWRRISGTDRLSVHAYGAAIDLKAQLGGYWRWSGQKAGAVGGFDNKIPEPVVRAFERHGFIWGGKWHHYDGMHFEYRPELILHARMMHN